MFREWQSILPSYVLGSPTFCTCQAANSFVFSQPSVSFLYACHTFGTAFTFLFWTLKRQRRIFLVVVLRKHKNPSKLHVSEVFPMRKSRLRRKQTVKVLSGPYLPKNPGNPTLSSKNPENPHPPTLYPVISS